MKLRLFLSVLFAALTCSLSAAPTVPLSGVATSDASEVILDVYADPGENELRSFGIRIHFNPADLTCSGAGHYDGLWFLSGEDGSHFTYGPPTEPAPGVVRLVGGRLGGSAPTTGNSGSRILLASLQFARLNGNAPQFHFSLASPPPFANFVSTSGHNLDSGVEGFTGSVLQQAASPDSDNDGLPDDYEITTFGNLTTSDGSSDSDGDGRSDEDEFEAGTDPTDPSSFMQLWITRGLGGPVLNWNGIEGRVYRLDWSNDLQSFGLSIDGIAGRSAVQDLPAPHFPFLERAFYRLHVENPTPGR